MSAENFDLGSLLGKFAEGARKTSEGMSKWWYPSFGTHGLQMGDQNHLEQYLYTNLVMYGLSRDKSIFTKSNLMSFDSMKEIFQFIKKMKGNVLYTKYSNNNTVTGTVVVFDHGFISFNIPMTVGATRANKYSLEYNTASYDSKFITGQFNQILI